MTTRPETPPGSVAAMTPGQAFYAAYRRAHSYGGLADWGELTAENGAAIEAGAQAAVDESDSTALAQLAMARDAISDLAAARDRARQALAQATAQGITLMGERDSLARQLADLRTSLDYAAGQWESNAMPHTHPVRSGEYRSVMAACARDLRYALKANAPDAEDVRGERDRYRAALEAIATGTGTAAAKARAALEPTS